MGRETFYVTRGDLFERNIGVYPKGQYGITTSLAFFVECFASQRYIIVEYRRYND